MIVTLKLTHFLTPTRNLTLIVILKLRHFLTLTRN